MTNVGPDCCCSSGGGCGTICFTVTGCSAAVIGATVSVTGPSSFSATCTTNGVGLCCVTIPSAGTYSYSISKTGFNTGTGSVSATCTTNNVSVTLSTATDWSCSGCPTCCDCTGKTPPFSGGTRIPLYSSFNGGTATTSAGFGDTIVFPVTTDCATDTSKVCTEGCPSGPGCGGAPGNPDGSCCGPGTPRPCGTAVCNNVQKLANGHSAISWTMTCNSDGTWNVSYYVLNFGYCLTGCPTGTTSGTCQDPVAAFGTNASPCAEATAVGPVVAVVPNMADCSKGLLSLSVSVNAAFGTCTAMDACGNNIAITGATVSGTLTITN